MEIIYKWVALKSIRLVNLNESIKIYFNFKRGFKEKLITNSINLSIARR